MHDFSLTLPDLDAVASWLDRVTAHISDDETIPVLTRVQITVGARHLLAVATDRYTLAVSRLEAPTGDVRGEFTVPGPWVRDVVAHYADEGRYDAVTLTLTADTITAAVPYDEPIRSPRGDDFGGPWRPGWRAMVASSLDHPADPAPVRVRADLLARFAPAAILTLSPDGTVSMAEGGGPVPYTVHSAGPQRPVALLSRDLIGLLAPIRADRPQQSTDPAEGTDPRAVWDLWAPILAAREPVAA